MLGRFVVWPNAQKYFSKSIILAQGMMDICESFLVSTSFSRKIIMD